jgi:phosphinothricin acetyltransferase
MATLAVPLTVRRAVAADAARIAAIWNHEIRATLATTDTRARTLAQQRAWLARHAPPYPVLVALVDDAVAGFAALTPYRPKPAFRQTVEDSVYVDRAHRGRGVARALLGRLLEEAAAAGHHSVVARITAGNRASRRLHEALGFALVGIEREVALKLGQWLDVAVYQRPIRW